MRICLQYFKVKFIFGKLACMDNILNYYNSYNMICLSFLHADMSRPFEVMFGRKPILPVDIKEGLPPVNLLPKADDDTEKALEVLTNNRIKIMESVCFISVMHDLIMVALHACIK